MRIALEHGVMREFDPYSAAFSITTGRTSPKGFLVCLCKGM